MFYILHSVYCVGPLFQLRQSEMKKALRWDSLRNPTLRAASCYGCGGRNLSGCHVVMVSGWKRWRLEVGQVIGLTIANLLTSFIHIHSSSSSPGRIDCLELKAKNTKLSHCGTAEMPNVARFLRALEAAQHSPCWAAPRAPGSDSANHADLLTETKLWRDFSSRPEMTLMIFLQAKLIQKRYHLGFITLFRHLIHRVLSLLRSRSIKDQNACFWVRVLLKPTYCAWRISITNRQKRATSGPNGLRALS